MEDWNMKTKFVTAVVMLRFIVPMSFAQPASSPPSKANPDTTAPAVYSQNPEANELFLKAREFAKKGNPRVPGGALANAREAVKLYEEAVKKDPKFALAYVEMARAWLSLGYSDSDGMSNEQIVPPAKAALQKALELDENLAEAHLALASVCFSLDYNWEKAEAEYKRALTLRPDNAAAHTSYAAYLGAMGRFDDAVAEAKKGAELAPSGMADITLARIYYSMRHYDQAADYCLTSLKKEDNVLGHFFLGFIYVAQQKRDEAIAEFQKATTYSKNGGALAGLAYGYAVSGRKEDAEKIINELKRGTGSGLIVPYRLAAVYVALGDKDQAIEWLKKEYQDRGNWMTQLKVDPVMDPLRSDPRFQDLMRRMKFPS
jgi:tetratricopeptide (TPR) repeat protein